MSTDGSGSMSGKTVLVTGGTGGIGKATASGLAGLGARVGIIGRDQERAEATVREIQAQHPSASVDAFVADLSSQAEVRQMAADVLATYPRLEVLINNVGGFWAHRHPSPSTDWSARSLWTISPRSC